MPRIGQYRSEFEKLTPEEIAGIIQKYEQGGRRMLELSDTEFQQWSSEMKRLLKNGTLAEGLKESWDSLRTSFQRRVTERQMLSAALALVQNDSARFAALSSPFIYRQTETGFEIESCTRFKGKPVVLSFPRSE